ncbi:hypothetical protein ACFX11_031984 [Malus domestica]
MKKIAPEMIMVVHPTANPVGSSSGHGGLNEGVDFNNSHQDLDLRVRDPMRERKPFVTEESNLIESN